MGKVTRFFLSSGERKSFIFLLFLLALLLFTIASQKSVFPESIESKYATHLEIWYYVSQIAMFFLSCATLIGLFVTVYFSYRSLQTANEQIKLEKTRYREDRERQDLKSMQEQFYSLFGLLSESSRKMSEGNKPDHEIFVLYSNVNRFCKARIKIKENSEGLDRKYLKGKLKEWFQNSPAVYQYFMQLAFVIKFLDRNLDRKEYVDLTKTTFAGVNFCWIFLLFLFLHSEDNELIGACEKFKILNDFNFKMSSGKTNMGIYFFSKYCFELVPDEVFGLFLNDDDKLENVKHTALSNIENLKFYTL